MLQLHVQSFVMYFGIIVNYKIHNFTKLFLIINELLSLRN